MSDEEGEDPYACFSLESDNSEREQGGPSSSHRQSNRSEYDAEDGVISPDDDDDDDFEASFVNNISPRKSAVRKRSNQRR